MSRDGWYFAKSQGKRCDLEIGVTNNTVSVHDNIIYNNRDTDSVSDISDLSDGSRTFFNNISTEPTFEESWYLDIGGTGAIDAGSGTAINLVISGTTQTDGSADVNMVDLGYHYVTGSTAVDATSSTAVLMSRRFKMPKKP